MPRSRKKKSYGSEKIIMLAGGIAVGGVIGYLIPQVMGAPAQSARLRVFVNPELNNYISTLMTSGGTAPYNPLFDINHNNVIDIFDANYFANHANQWVELSATLPPIPAP